MTVAANHPPHVLAPEVAQETLREMAAVIRTIFGVGLRTARQASTASVAPAAAPPQLPSSPVADAFSGGPVPSGAISIPGISVQSLALTGIPVPGMSVSQPNDDASEGMDGNPLHEIAFLDD